MITTTLNETLNTNDMWFWWVGIALNKMGINSGFTYYPNLLETATAAGFPDIFDFNNDNDYRYNLIKFAHEADARGVLTNDVQQTLVTVFANIPDSEIDSELKRLLTN